MNASAVNHERNSTHIVPGARHHFRTRPQLWRIPAKRWGCTPWCGWQLRRCNTSGCAEWTSRSSWSARTKCCTTEKRTIYARKVNFKVYQSTICFAHWPVWRSYHFAGICVWSVGSLGRPRQCQCGSKSAVQPRLPTFEGCTVSLRQTPGKYSKTREIHIHNCLSVL